MNNDYNKNRKQNNHFPVFNTRLSKFLMNNGARCVDITPNKRTGYEGKTIFYFEQDENLMNLINQYTIIYHND
jgi:hypothetical protein